MTSPLLMLFNQNNHAQKQAGLGAVGAGRGGGDDSCKLREHSLLAENHNVDPNTHGI